MSGCKKIVMTKAVRERLQKDIAYGNDMQAYWNRYRRDFQMCIRDRYCGTFTAGGLKVEVKDGKLHILQEGRIKKFKQEVEQITFSADFATETGQKVLYVTERAVFELLDGKLTLTEIAPGVDLEKDVLGQMEFKPAVADNLKTMDERLFRDELIGLKA